MEVLDSPSTSEVDEASARRRWWSGGLLLVALVFLVFINTLPNRFTFDDVSTIENNPALRSPRHAMLYFVRPFFAVGRPVSGPVEYDYYRPAVFLSYLADRHLWGEGPMGYHLSNVFLHAVAALLVFLLLGRLGMSRWASFLGAALFAVHPAIADSVASISGRTDPLCAIFFLASLYFYVWARQHSGGRFLVLLLCSCLAFVAALLAKETAIAIPLVLAAYEFAYRETKGGGKFLLLSPHYCLTFLYLLWRSHVVPASLRFSGDVAELIRRLMTMAQFMVSHTSLLIVPHDLGFERYTRIIDSIAAPMAVVSTACVLFVSTSVLFRARMPVRVRFLILWFLGCFAPYLYFFVFDPGKSIFTPPHFLYLSSIAFFALCALGAAWFVGRGRGQRAGLYRRALVTVTAVVIVFLSLQTIRRNVVWRDDLTFFLAMGRYAPQSPRVHVGLGNALLKSGRPGHALAEYARAYELARSAATQKPFPDSAAGVSETGWQKITDYYAGTALAGMGDAYLMVGETGRAIECYAAALSENAFDAAIHTRIARAQEFSGDLDGAIASYERALRIDKRLLDADVSLHVAQVKKEVYDQAERIYLAAVASGKEDTPEALYGRALMMRLDGKPQVAAALLRDALAKDPLHFGANMALGRILLAQGEHDAALGNFSAAFSAHPTSALAAYEIAVTTLTMGDMLAAESWAAKAYELEPESFYGTFLDGVREHNEGGHVEE